MGRFYLSYRLKLEEPLILGYGSQVGNVLQTQDFIPGSTILGLCASLYLKNGGTASENGRYSKEFRALFLSDGTIYSPAYPYVDNKYHSFPMPLSVMGCKYYGFTRPGGPDPYMHGFRDYLSGGIPDRCEFGLKDKSSCDAMLEHKSGFCYWVKDEVAYCNHEVEKRILTHNQVSDLRNNRELFSYECISEGQQFYGQISFTDDRMRDLIFYLLKNYSVATLGKARNRGYGRVRFFPSPSDHDIRNEFSGETLSKATFSIYLFSDAILPDRNLNYCTTIDEDTLSYWLGLPDAEGFCVYRERKNGFKSFYKSNPVMGFNQHRCMPLPMEWAVSKGSVFTVSYNGDADIEKNLQKLETEGIGIRRNEGFGMVVLNHSIHRWGDKEE